MNITKKCLLFHNIPCYGFAIFSTSFRQKFELRQNYDKSLNYDKNQNY